MKRIHIAIGLIWLLLAQQPCSAQQLESSQRLIDDVIRRHSPSIVQLERIGVGGGAEDLAAVSISSGTVISRDGLILTSGHFVDGSISGIIATDSNGRRWPARLIARDYVLNLGLLQAESNIDDWKPIDLPAAESPAVGTTVIAMGRVLTADELNISVGIVSARDRLGGRAIQIDAKTSSLNYGGLVCDLSGEPLGIIVPLSNQSTGPTAGMEWYDSGIGFAVPTAAIRLSLKTLRSGRNRLIGRLGIEFSSTDSPFAPPVIAAIFPGSPAAIAGLKVGDRLTAINQRRPNRIGLAEEWLGALTADDPVELGIERDQVERLLSVRAVEKLPAYPQPMIGILPGEANREGMLVRFVLPDSPAALAGIKAGDRLLSINEETPANRGEWQALLATHRAADEIELGWQPIGDSNPQRSRTRLQFMQSSPWPWTPNTETALLSAQTLRSAEFKNEITLLASEKRTPPAVVLVWLPEAGPFDQEKCLQELNGKMPAGLALLIVESADRDRWHPDELEAVIDALTLARQKLQFDDDRLAVGGMGSGASLASLAGFQHRSTFRGLVLNPARLSQQLTEFEAIPGKPLHVWLQSGGKDESGMESFSDQRAWDSLSEAKIPCHRELNAPSSDADFFRRLAPWLLQLDRL